MSQIALDHRTASPRLDRPRTVDRARTSSRTGDSSALDPVARLFRGLMFVTMWVIYNIVGLCAYLVMAVFAVLAPIIVFFGTLAVIALVLHLCGIVLQGLGAV